MKKILGSILTIGVVAAFMGAGTFAYYSDVESATFTITGGIIDLEVDGENPWCESIELELKPTWNWEDDFTLHMTAESNPAKAWFRIRDMVESGGITSEPEFVAEGGTFDPPDCTWNYTNWVPIDNISDFIKVDISFDSDHEGYRMWYLKKYCSGYTWQPKPLSWKWQDNLNLLPDLHYLVETGWIPLTQDCDLPHNLTPCHDYTFHLSFHNLLDDDDNNEYQGDEVTFELEFYVTQTDNTSPP